jgi:hypothetical protein
MPLSENTVKIKAAALRSRLQTLPVKVGDTAVLFSKQRFAQGNWIGNNVDYRDQLKKHANQLENETKKLRTDYNKGM